MVGEASPRSCGFAACVVDLQNVHVRRPLAASQLSSAMDLDPVPGVWFGAPPCRCRTRTQSTPQFQSEVLEATPLFREAPRAVLPRYWQAQAIALKARTFSGALVATVAIQVSAFSG